MPCRPALPLHTSESEVECCVGAGSCAKLPLGGSGPARRARRRVLCKSAETGRDLGRCKGVVHTLPRHRWHGAAGTRPKERSGRALAPNRLRGGGTGMPRGDGLHGTSVVERAASAMRVAQQRAYSAVWMPGLQGARWGGCGPLGGSWSVQGQTRRKSVGASPPPQRGGGGWGCWMLGGERQQPCAVCAGLQSPPCLDPVRAASSSLRSCHATGWWCGCTECTLCQFRRPARTGRSWPSTRLRVHQREGAGREQLRGLQPDVQQPCSMHSATQRPARPAARPGKGDGSDCGAPGRNLTTHRPSSKRTRGCHGKCANTGHNCGVRALLGA